MKPEDERLPVINVAKITEVAEGQNSYKSNGKRKFLKKFKNP